jgi:tetratricopeptide (TPR) repeat protein
MRAALTIVLCMVLVGSAAAQGAGDKPDTERAVELYKQAEAEMAAGRFAAAAEDYAHAYDITKDPVLFFKIASAYDKALRCDLALTYYRRYLRDGKPNEEFSKLTTERITACEKTNVVSAANPPAPSSAPAPAPTPAPAPAPAASGVADPFAPTPAEAAAASQTPAAATTAPPDDSTKQLTDKPSLSGSRPSKLRGAAYIVLGVGLALGTVGVVSAMSAEAAEKDLEDLYSIRVMGIPPEFSPDEQERYDDLVDQGERYQTLSWVAFGAAGAAFVGATALFLLSRSDDEAPPPVSLQVTGKDALVTGGFSF